jgi:hypothetical protein
MKANKGWYMFYYQECPQCGRSHTWKEFVYFKDKQKPKNRHDRYKESQVWDGCGL